MALVTSLDLDQCCEVGSSLRKLEPIEGQTEVLEWLPIWSCHCHPQQSESFKGALWQTHTWQR